MARAFRTTALVAALSALGIACGAYAQTGVISPNTGATGSMPKSNPTAGDASYASKPGANGAKLALADAKFIEKAAERGVAEVELAQLAERKAQNDQVKQFAQRMRQDHSRANDELKQATSGKNVMLPTAVDKSTRREMDKLEKLSGADFDREYMKHMVKDHRKDVKAFEHEARRGKDGDIKGFAEKTLPILRDHLQMAQAADGAVRGAKGTASSK